MKTLFDFVTHIKIVEYLIAIGCIAVYMVYWEVLKPKPFKAMVETAREDRQYLKETGGALKTIAKIATAPFVGLAYIAMLPASFLYALGAAAVEKVAPEATFGWSPVRAYFAGRKRRKEAKKAAKK